MMMVCFVGVGVVRTEVAGGADHSPAHASREEQNGQLDAQHDAQGHDRTNEVVCRFFTFQYHGRYVEEYLRTVR